VAEISTMMGLSARVVTRWFFENEKGRVYLSGLEPPAQASRLPEHPHSPARL
jgi:hypothetical protein